MSAIYQEQDEQEPRVNQLQALCDKHGIKIDRSKPKFTQSMLNKINKRDKELINYLKTK